MEVWKYGRSLFSRIDMLVSSSHEVMSAVYKHQSQENYPPQQKCPEILHHSQFWKSPPRCPKITEAGFNPQHYQFSSVPCFIGVLLFTSTVTPGAPTESFVATTVPPISGPLLLSPLTHFHNLCTQYLKFHSFQSFIWSLSKTDSKFEMSVITFL